jgi:hypothetical protein
METRTLKDNTIVNFKPSNHTYEAIEPSGIIYEPRSVTGILKVAMQDFGIGAMAGRKNLRETILENRKMFSDFTYTEKEFETLIKDLNKIAVAKWASGANRGSEVHDFIECYAKGLQPDFSSDKHIAMLQESVLKWYKERVIKALSIERLVYSKEPLYAGKFDLEADVKDYGRCLVDYKTGSSLSYSQAYPIQLCAYMYAMLQEDSGNPFGRLIVHINRDTGVVKERFYDAKTYQRDLSVWLSIVNISNYTIDYKKEWK